MPLKTQSVEHSELIELARLSVEAAAQDGGMIAAGEVAQRLLDAHPDCQMPFDELFEAIARFAIARRVRPATGSEFKVTDSLGLTRVAPLPHNRRNIAHASMGWRKPSPSPQMSIIWIVCPVTGEDVSTSIETDAESFAALPTFMLTLKCPSCEDVHPWKDMGGHLVPSELRPKLN